MAGRPRKPKTDLAKRLISFREKAGLSADDVARACGVSPSALANYERGDNIPDAAFIRDFVRATGADPWALLSGEPDMSRNASAANDNLVLIPRFDVRAAAGAGSLALTEDVSSYFAFERAWMQRALPRWAGPNAVVGILEGAGDSMEPTIRDGDLIMAVRDPPEWAVDAGGVFVVLHHGQLRIKRLQVDMRSGDVTLISDNGRYAPETVARDRLEFDLAVLAQVFFAGGRLRGMA